MHDLPVAIERLLARSASERQVGPFLLVRQLGRGGFAPVWLAKETFGGETLRAAAVKIFALDARDAGASRRIIEEARALCRVEHPNVVRFYSLAVDEQLGVLGLGMEFVAGRSLAAHLDHAGKLRMEQVVELGLAMASALSAVHRAGIVHRDVKPANIMETAYGYKLVDFGIASAPATFPDVSTWVPSNDPDSTGRVAALQSGTLGYVDPVTIATGAPASPESDLYALGATLYECATGHLPAASAAKTLDERILDGRSMPPSVSIYGDYISEELAAIIDRMVSPDRARRFASAEEVTRSFERMRISPPSRKRPLPPKIIATGIVAIVAVPLIGYWFTTSRQSAILAATLAATIESAFAAPAAEIMQSLEPSADIPRQTEMPSVGSSTRSTVAEKPQLQKQKSASVRPLPTPAPEAGPPVTVLPAPSPILSAIQPPPAPTNSAKTKLILPPARDW